MSGAEVFIVVTTLADHGGTDLFPDIVGVFATESEAHEVQAAVKSGSFSPDALQGDFEEVRVIRRVVGAYIDEWKSHDETYKKDGFRP